eukprot:4094231-Amphidinium_carterae.1
MADTTQHGADAIPELPLRQLFQIVLACLPEGLRRLLADEGVLTLDHIASFGDSFDSFKTSMRGISIAEELGGSDAVRTMNLMFLCTVWRKASNLSAELDKRRARMEEEPDSVPEIQFQDYAQMRACFLAKHKDFILTEQREPHKKYMSASCGTTQEWGYPLL